MSRRPIHHTFGPLVTSQDVWLSLALLFQPWTWRRSSPHRALRQALEETYQSSTFLFAEGREALHALLKAAQLQPGDEVVVQGYTCAVVPQAILAAGGMPVYVDIDPYTLNLTPASVAAAITSKTRAVICQHTFGIPADTAALRQLCDEQNLLLIEDCAHVLPSEERNNPAAIGTQGDAILLSFGRDKAISGVSGGAILTTSDILADALRAEEQAASRVSTSQLIQLLLYPLHYTIAKTLWPLRLGKPYLRLMQMLKLMPVILRPSERAGQPHRQIRSLPNPLAALTLQQWKEREAITTHRQQLANLYLQYFKDTKQSYATAIDHSPAPQKFPLFVGNPQHLRRRLKQKQIYLFDGWCGAVVNPYSVDQTACMYRPGMCPAAEEAAASILSLPTHPTMTEAQAHDLLRILKEETTKHAL